MRRFSIRSLLIFTAVVGCLLAGPVNRARKQKEGRSWVAAERGHITFASSFDEVTQTFVHPKKPLAPAWLVRALGIDYFDSVHSIVLDCEEVDDLRPITNLSSLRFLGIMIEIDDDLDFGPLRELTHLEEVYLDYTHISAERLAGLREMLPGVKVTATNHLGSDA
ncbi:MAG: hypothetical protein AAGD07_25295 [Planctomycetota bacterium]